jgi:hypothetical protein
MRRNTSKRQGVNSFNQVTGGKVNCHQKAVWKGGAADRNSIVDNNQNWAASVVYILHVRIDSPLPLHDLHNTIDVGAVKSVEVQQSQHSR